MDSLLSLLQHKNLATEEACQYYFEQLLSIINDNELLPEKLAKEHLRLEICIDSQTRTLHLLHPSSSPRLLRYFSEVALKRQITNYLFRSLIDVDLSVADVPEQESPTAIVPTVPSTPTKLSTIMNSPPGTPLPSARSNASIAVMMQRRQSFPLDAVIGTLVTLLFFFAKFSNRTPNFSLVCTLSDLGQELNVGSQTRFLAPCTSILSVSSWSSNQNTKKRKKVRRTHYTKKKYNLPRIEQKPTVKQQ